MWQRLWKWGHVHCDSNVLYILQNVLIKQWNHQARTFISSKVTDQSDDRTTLQFKYVVRQAQTYNTTRLFFLYTFFVQEYFYT